MKKCILKFLLSEDGPTAVEYAVMLAMIVMACIGAISIMGESTRDSLQDSQSQITTAMTGS